MDKWKKAVYLNLAPDQVVISDQFFLCVEYDWVVALTDFISSQVNIFKVPTKQPSKWNYLKEIEHVKESNFRSEIK